jgi:outer membrane protein TolC
LALGLLLAPAGVWAQAAGNAPELQDWRAANEAVAQFKRGHMDLLKWERSNLPKAAPSVSVEPDLFLMDPADAVRAAWRRHPDLRRAQSRLGAAATRQVAEGRLAALDPSLQRRVDDFDELLAVATGARKNWIEAVAARKVLRFREAALTSAEAGNELGRRMVSVGNWSPLQATPLQLASAMALMDLRRARLAANQAEGALRMRLGLGVQPMLLALPDDLPELPTTAMTRKTWAERLEAVQGQLPGMTATRNRVASNSAFEVLSASHELASISSGEVLRLRRYITEETVLHYNGMLKSVWDLLDEVGNQATAEIDAIDAQRDFWLAEADLQWTLQGGAPTSFVSLGGGSAQAAGPPGH